MRNHAYYRLRKNTSSTQPYYWSLIVPTEDIIFTSETYTSKDGAKVGIESTRKNCQNDDNYHRAISSDEKHYFTLIAQNNEPLGRSNLHITDDDMEQDLEAMKTYGNDAEIIDETGEASNNAEPIKTTTKPWLSN